MIENIIRCFSERLRGTLKHSQILSERTEPTGRGSFGNGCKVRSNNRTWVLWSTGPSELARERQVLTLQLVTTPA